MALLVLQLLLAVTGWRILKAEAAAALLPALNDFIDPRFAHALLLRRAVINADDIQQVIRRVEIFRDRLLKAGEVAVAGCARGSVVSAAPLGE